jgi:hypothetical protein
MVVSIALKTTPGSSLYAALVKIFNNSSDFLYVTTDTCKERYSSAYNGHQHDCSCQTIRIYKTIFQTEFYSGDVHRAEETASLNLLSMVIICVEVGEKLL